MSGSSALYGQLSFFNFSYPGPATIPVGSTCSASLAGNIGQPVVTSTVGATITQSAFDPVQSGFLLSDQFPPGLYLLYWKVADNQGHSATFSFTVTLVDNAPPVLVKPARDTVVACSATGDHLAALSAWISSRAGMIASDACTPPSMLAYEMHVNGPIRDSAGVIADFLISLDTLSCGFHQVGGQIVDNIKGRVQVDFFVRDAAGNLLVDQAEFAALDTVPPSISGPENIEPCGGGNDQAALNAWINQHGNATLTDVCSSASWNNTYTWLLPGGLGGSGTIGVGPYPQAPAQPCDWYVDVTFKATDECGNPGTGALRFRIKDSQPPVFTNLAPVVTLPCPATLPTQPAATITDNCDNNPVVTSTQQTTIGLCEGNYTVAVTWKATDDCGNTGTALQTFQVIDTTGPVFSLVPAPKTIRCDTFMTPPAPLPGTELAAIDACGSVTEYSTQIISSQNPDPAVCEHYNYTLTRVFTAEDDCGNTRTATQVISVIDSLGPVFTGFTDTTLVCEVQPLTPPPSATDACSGLASAPVLINTSISPDPCGDSYVKTLQWQAMDVCGNPSLFSQDLHVQDTVAPVLSGVPADVTVECTGIPPAPGPGVVTAVDNCDETADIVMTQTEIRNPDTMSCDHWSNYMIRRQWTATDNCGNSTAQTQTIQVEDNTGPVLVAPIIVLLPNDSGQCGANALLPALIALYDECSSTTSTLSLADTAALVAPAGTPVDSLGEVPVDTVVFQWAAPNMPPAVPVVGSVLLSIRLEKVDSDLSSETFQILGEGDTLLGNTVITGGHCVGFSTTVISLSSYLVNSWLSDGLLVLKLAPNGFGNLAINPDCTDARAIATLSYAVAHQQVPIDLKYSINNSAPAPFPPAAGIFLPVGATTVTYIATDCAGNSSSATASLVVQDVEPPMITAPAPITAYVGSNNCLSTINLPFPTINENCTLTQDSVFSPLTLVKFETDPNLPGQLVPKDVTLNIPGVIPNTVSSSKLVIRHRGDNANPGEFYRVFDENNVLLSVTTAGTPAGECQIYNEKNIALTPAQLNTWAANSVVSVRLRANRLASSGDWINPCGPLATDQTDGTSQVQAVLVYDYAAVQYTVTNSGGTVVSSGALNDSQTPVTLSPGLYTVTYRVADNAGAEGMTTFTITVRDTVAPQANCQPVITIFTNPSGFVPYILQPAQINNNSIDNCSLGPNLQYQLSQTSFACPTQASQNVQVVLTVRDSSNNTDACTTLVVVRTENLIPTYDPLCQGGTLTLHANAPAPLGGYSYSWVKSTPIAFNSPLPNPVVNSNAQSGHQGLYNVTVTGATGCVSTGSVVVAFAFVDVQPNLTAPVQVCEGNTITLSTSSYQGSNVTYSWYAGSPPLGTLLATTLTQSYNFTPPSPGVYEFYVQVGANNCSTQESNPKTVTVNARPTGTVNFSNLTVCSCEPILLGTMAMGPGMSYQWNGPGGSWTGQSPLVTICASQALHQGNYTLVITQNGCMSNPSTTTVTVVPPLVTPVISGDGTVCTGEPIQMVASPASNPPYYWTGPNGFADTTAINSLTLSGATPALNGSWKVKYRIGNCESSYSSNFNVEVQNAPIVTASANSPLCSGALDTLQLEGNSNITPYMPMWTGPQGFGAVIPNPIKVDPKPGWYYFTGTTSNGCKGMDSVQVVLVNPPSVTLTSNAPTCATGSGTAIIQGVLNPINSPVETYNWTHNGSMFTTLTPALPLPTFSEDDNGPYTLQVIDTFGCVSNLATYIISTHNIPVVPQLLPADSICVGQTLTVMVENEGDYLSNYTFNWSTPQGIIPDTTSSLTYPNATAAHNGVYTVIVYNTEDCPSVQSQPLTVHVAPNPAAPVIPQPAPVCAGDSLHLCVPPAIGGQITYNWMVPGNGSGAGNCFIINNVNPLTSGAYKVQISINGCLSPFSEPVFVSSKPLPGKPTAKTQTPAVCLDAPDTLILFTSITTPGAKYQWFNTITEQALAPASFSPFLQLTNLSGFAPGVHSFYVEAELDGCISRSLFPVLVRFDQIPAITAMTDNDTLDCTVLDLCALAPSTGAGHWSIINAAGLTLSDSNALCPLVNGAQAGNTYTFVWSLSNGGCLNYSSATLAVDLVQPEQALVNVSLIDTCGGSAVQLSAVQGQSSSGMWVNGANQDNLVFIEDLFDPNTLVTSAFSSGFQANTYFFKWRLADIGCGPSEATVEVRIKKVPVVAGQDQTICVASGCTTLEAQLQSGEVGQWHAISPAIPDSFFSSINSPNSVVCGLQTGANILYWETNNGFCGLLSRDTVVLTYQVFPTVQPDVIEVPFGSEVEFNVLLNDIAGGQADVVITDFPDHAQRFDSIGEGIFVYQPTTSFSGQDQMVYQVCNLLCPNAPCAATTVLFNVGGAGECFIPTLITPNGDDTNDQFALPEACWTGDAAIEVTIFNQWGDQVFHDAAYANQFDGKLGGENLPVGTYFFVVKLPAESKERTGFLVIQR